MFLLGPRSSWLMKDILPVRVAAKDTWGYLINMSVVGDGSVSSVFPPLIPQFGFLLPLHHPSQIKEHFGPEAGHVPETNGFRFAAAGSIWLFLEPTAMLGEKTVCD